MINNYHKIGKLAISNRTIALGAASLATGVATIICAANDMNTKKQNEMIETAIDTSATMIGDAIEAIVENAEEATENIELA